MERALNDSSSELKRMITIDATCMGGDGIVNLDELSGSRYSPVHTANMYTFALCGLVGDSGVLDCSVSDECNVSAIFTRAGGPNCSDNDWSNCTRSCSNTFTSLFSE